MNTATYTRRYRPCLALLATFVAASAIAAGDAGHGAVLAYTCMGCHGIEGYRNAYPSYRVPRLGGQKSAYIEAALKAYRAGTRAHPTMQAQGSSLSDQDIQDLAAWFGSLGSPRDDVDANDVAGIGAAALCVTCHGKAGQAIVPQPPTLSGQQQDYLVHALQQYKDGARSGTVMSSFAATLSDEDMRAIAAFYAAREGLHTPDRKEQQLAQESP